MTDEQMQKSVGKIICHHMGNGDRFFYLLLKAKKLSFRCFDLTVLSMGDGRQLIQTWQKIVPDYFRSFND